MNNELNAILENSFSAISVLLVFVTILFGLRYPEIKQLLDEPLSKDKPKALERQKEQIKRDIVRWLPIVALNFIVVYTMAPLALKTISTSTLAIFHFDFIRTSFVLIWLFNIAFFLGSIILLVKLICKIYECKTTDSNSKN